MGGGFYNTTTRNLRAKTMAYNTKTVAEVFDSKLINNAMNPHGINLRESRDSAEHPESVAIIIALDVTGSMGSVPHHLVKTGLPDLMEKIIKGGVEHPQVLFLGIGDHECDRSPLQVGQFESSDELLDKWLTDVYLEGGGGGNAGESYGLAWYFAGYHTAIDCHEKRKQKGILFTIGDEPFLKNYPGQMFENLMGPGQYNSKNTADELLAKAREKYEVYHIHVKETTSGSRRDREETWGQLLSNYLLVAQHHDDVSDIIADTVLKHCKGISHKHVDTPVSNSKDIPEEEVIL